MASFAARSGVSQAPEFVVKAGTAAVRVATQVMTETAEKIAVDRKRRALALTVLTDPQGIASRFALILAAQDAAVSEPDEVVEARVWSLWDSIAGVEQDDWGQQ